MAETSFAYSADRIAAAVGPLLEAIAPDEAGRTKLAAVLLRSEVLKLARRALLEGTPERTTPSAAAGPDAPLETPNAPPPGDETERRPHRRPAAGEGHFIQNAGLVLLAPFLNRLFERLALAGEGVLMDAPLAVAVLHYLATGQEGAAEFQMVLPKVLCGLPIEEPVAIPAAVPEAAKEETHQLLVSAIEHWSVLKDTSPDGLREAFLTRPGKISEDANDAWLLQVEQRAYDMLIARAPWTFNWVKLPWMRRPLRVEWVD
jgi:hypothetical protein